MARRVNPVREIAVESERARRSAASTLAARELKDRLAGELAADRMRESVREWRVVAAERAKDLPPERSQLPPDRSEWKRVVYYAGGRGSGKTWCASHIFAELIVDSPPGEFGIVAPTFGDAVSRCMCSMNSGLIIALGGKVSVEGNSLVEKGDFIANWTSTKGQLHLRNGSIVYCDGGDDGALRLQGANLLAAWVDEIGNLRMWKATWDETLRYAVRLEPALIIATGTPKRDRAARALVRQLLDDPDVVKRQLFTGDNLKNLAPAARDEYLRARGTALERQELEGVLVEGAENALWDREMLDACRLTRMPRDEDDRPIVNFARVVVAIDAAGSDNEDSDQTGIVVAALGDDGHGYVLEDLSGKYKPEVWAKRALSAYNRHMADKIVAETNHGGDMIRAVVQAVSTEFNYGTVRASRGKVVRAEPVAAAYAEGRVHHVGSHLRPLEDQMCDFIPVPRAGDKNDRVDALVWAMTELGIVGQSMDWSEVYAPVDPGSAEAMSELEHNPWMDVYGPERQDERSASSQPASTPPSKAPPEPFDPYKPRQPVNALEMLVDAQMRRPR